MECVKNKLSKLSLSTISAFLYFALAPGAFAQGGGGDDELGTIPRPTILPNINAGGFISGLIGLIIIVAFIAAFIYLIWGALQWITSGGDEAGIQAARNRIIQALIGLIIVVATWAIFQLVQSIFGIKVIGGDLDKLFQGLFPRAGS